MTILNAILRKFGYVKSQPARRALSAGAVNRLTANWITQPTSLDSELRMSLRTIRARSRDLARNNDYAKAFFGILSRNVVGPSGIIMQSRVQTGEGTPKRALNDRVEEAWRHWGRKGSCDMTGRCSWLDIQHLVMKTLARDGEVLIRKIKGNLARQNNTYGFALQVIPADHLDEDYNLDRTSSGSTIKMGVEKDVWGRPLAYYLRTRNPAETVFGSSMQGERYERVSASEIEHVFLSDESAQTRGLPWMYAAMLRLQMLGGYEEAEVVRARVDASKMGFYTTPAGDEYLGDSKDKSGNTIEEMEPGMLRKLPAGWSFQSFDPTSPSGNFPVFVKAMLRGIASGLSVSYNTLASDLEGVNYSSIRQGVLDEREQWRVVQAWFIEHVCEPIFAEWLDMAILTGQLDAGAGENLSLRICTACRWQARGWGWVDPRNDMEASCKAINNGLKTRQSVLAEQGLDLEDVFRQLKHEQELAAEYGVHLEPVPADLSAGTEPTEGTDGNEDDQDRHIVPASGDYTRIR